MKSDDNSPQSVQKVNERRSERICSLGRTLSGTTANFSHTFSNQWLERTLDDNAIRRIDIPEMFLWTDALPILLDDITHGFVGFPARTRSQIEPEIHRSERRKTL